MFVEKDTDDLTDELVLEDEEELEERLRMGRGDDMVERLADGDLEGEGNELLGFLTGY